MKRSQINAALKEMESVCARETALTKLFYEGVSAIKGVTVYGDFSVWPRGAVVALNLRGMDSAEAADALYVDYGIAVRAGAHCAPLLHEALGTTERGALRFSFSPFTTEEEVLAAVEAVRELAE